MRSFGYIFSSQAANIIFALFALGFLSTIWLTALARFQPIAQKLFHLMAIGRFVVLLAVLSSQCIDWWFINPQIEQYQQRVASLAHESEQSNYPQAAKESDETNFLGFVRQLSQQWEQLTHDVVAQKDKLAQLADIAESSVVDLMTLMALYLLKTLILPLLFIFLCRLGLSRLFTAMPVSSVNRIPS